MNVTKKYRKFRRHKEQHIHIVFLFFVLGALLFIYLFVFTLFFLFHVALHQSSTNWSELSRMKYQSTHKIQISFTEIITLVGELVSKSFFFSTKPFVGGLGVQ